MCMQLSAYLYSTCVNSATYEFIALENYFFGVQYFYPIWDCHEQFKCVISPPNW
jgi:hypothetical protein